MFPNHEHCTNNHHKGIGGNAANQKNHFSKDNVNNLIVHFNSASAVEFVIHYELFWIINNNEKNHLNI